MKQKVIINSTQTILFPEPERLDQFLLIEPSKEVNDANNGFKNLIFQEIKNFESFKSKSHISLGINKTTSELIEGDVRKFKTRLKNVPSFRIHLDNFGAFRSGDKRTIYINIINPEPVIAIFRMLFLRKTSFTPHITVAKNLDEARFDRVWPYFTERPYHTSFVCNAIAILMRPTGSDKPWILYDKIPLKTF